MTLIKEKLTIAAPGLAVPLYICGPGSSSMDAAWDLIAAGQMPLWGSLIMESQSGGRGRMGRRWQSPPGHIYSALRLPKKPPFDSAGASLALAVLVIESLAELGLEVKLKWPNDIIYDGGKTGGILLESKSAGLIAGIGLNLGAPPAGDWVAQRDQGAPRPGAIPFGGPPEKLWSALVKNMIIMYSDKFEKAGPAEFSRAAEKHLIWRGQAVRVIAPAAEPLPPQDPLRGRIDGLGPGGQLLLDDQSGRRYQLWSGTVCLE